MVSYEDNCNIPLKIDLVFDKATVILKEED